MITEYPILDRLTGGFGKGALITLVGGSLVGRSIFALNIVRNQMDLEIAPITAFMTAEQSAEVAQQTLLKMVVDEGETERIKIETVFVDIVKCCTDLDSLCQKIVLLVRVQKVEVVIIDSFHFLPFIEDYAYDKQPNISRRLKFLARELGITIIVTSRTNYQPSERSGMAGKRPQLSDLEYMGDLNYFSDVVLGMTRPEMYGVDVDAEGSCLKGIIQVEMLKSRKTIRELVSYHIDPDKGLIEEKKLLDKRNWF